MLLETVFHIYNYYGDGVYRENAVELWKSIIKIVGISEAIEPNIKEEDTSAKRIISSGLTSGCEDLFDLMIFEDYCDNLEVLIESFYYEDTPHIPLLHNKIFSELKAQYPGIIIVALNDFTGKWYSGEPYDNN